jgi:hypothetical protein
MADLHPTEAEFAIDLISRILLAGTIVYVALATPLEVQPDFHAAALMVTLLDTVNAPSYLQLDIVGVDPSVV